MHRRALTLLLALASLLAVTPVAAADPIADPFWPSVRVPRFSPPSISFVYGYGYRHPELSPRDCDPRLHGVPRTIKLSVVPITGGMRISFYSMNDPDVKRFRVTASNETLVAGKNPLPTWKDVAVPKGCRVITATVSGLKKGSYYSIWVDAILVRRLGAPGTWDRNVGQSGVFQAA